jgi:triphosphoribosyl-dephospho-CoA synthase
MGFPLSPAEISRAFIEACLAELRALKPGNVHIHAGGHGMEVADFETSAYAAAPFIADPSLKVGARIRRAVEASFQAAGCNTNLGILLLSAPLAAAAGTPVAGTTLFERVKTVLDALDHEDAVEVYAAIALANPGGLGTVGAHDVAKPPEPGLTLREAMVAAADRDQIAAEYVTSFRGIEALCAAAMNAGGAHGVPGNGAITVIYMTQLARIPDTHILRKQGREAALWVRRRAQELLPLVPSGTPVLSPDVFTQLIAFDGELKSRGLNPGTTADMTVAALFAAGLEAKLRRRGNA